MTASTRAARKPESHARNVEPADRNDKARDGAKPKSAEHKALTKAEAKAKRDQRYAARKARN